MTSMIRKVARRTIVCLAVLVGTLALASAAQADKAKARETTDAIPPTKGPAGLAFYDPPKNLPRGHGGLIWSRRITPQTPVAGVRSTRLVLYTSTAPRGKKSAVSGYVSVPRGKAPKGGWPVITWAHGTTGIADTCAPSRGITSGPPESFLRTWVAAGYAVAATDYQGLGTPGIHPYLVGTAEGRSVLDIVRAARQLDSSIGRRMIVTGVSQGGQSALFAASLAGRWTPDLKLRGTISYAPGSHLAEQKDLLPALTSPSSLSAVAAMILSGAITTSPDIEPAKILTDPALALFPQVNRICLPALSQPDSFGGLAPSTLIRDGADTTELDRALEAMNPAVKIDGPILLAQGSADSTAFPFYTDQLNGELEAKGDNVTYMTYPGVDHGGIVDAAEADAMAFFESRLPSR
jgi:dienelactone hydrolase